MDQIFVDRERELRWLQERLSSEKAELLILYGRRRIGKSTLVLRALKGFPKAIYFQHTLKSPKLQIQELQKVAGKVLEDPLLNRAPFSLLDEILLYLTQKGPLILVLDEFPYLVNLSPESPSLIQKVWDQSLKLKPFKLILIGSLMSTMEKLISYTGPLYGRKTGSWKLEPLPFKAFWEYISKRSVSLPPRRALEYWALVGGIPYYWNFFEFRNISKEMTDVILRKGSPLYEEGVFLLREELREPTKYNSILQVLATGPHPIGKVSNQLGEDSKKLSKYLNVLQELDLVSVEYPVTLKERRKRRGLYKIRDNFLRFWFRYLLPNITYLEAGEERLVLEKIRRTWSDFLGRVYEELALELTLEKVREKEPVRAWGRWWDREHELDGVVITESSLHVCEAKLSKDANLRKVKRALSKLIAQLDREGFRPENTYLWLFNAERSFWGEMSSFPTL